MALFKLRILLNGVQNIWSSSLSSPSPVLQSRLSSLALALELLTLELGLVGRKLDSIQRWPPALNCFDSMSPDHWIIVREEKRRFLTFIRSFTLQRPPASLGGLAVVVNSNCYLERKIHY